jgi:succinate dehydrogenase flavin-adding protein (antitoxin of CptAB toxin-antitoxin module)
MPERIEPDASDRQDKRHDDKTHRMKELERVRWRCRRGLLELDIVLGRFVEQHYAGLNELQQVAFDVLLDMPDNVPVGYDYRKGRASSGTATKSTVGEA